MRILVTGVAGFIGSHVAEHLATQGHAVRGLDAVTEYYDPSIKRSNLAGLKAKGIDLLRVDLAEDPLTPVLQDIEAIYHLAAQPGLSSQTPQRAFVRNNVRATKRLVSALDDHPTAKAFVFASSSSVYGVKANTTEEASLSPVSVYGQTKKQAEQIVRHHARRAQWDACILRLFSVYGPRERPDKLIPTAIRCARTRRPFPLYEGSERHRRSFTYVDDVVEGMTATLDRFSRCAGETINLGRPTSPSTLQVLRRVADVAGGPLCIRREPARPGDQRCTRARIEKARRLLGVSPTTSLEDGIATEVAWMERERIG